MPKDREGGDYAIGYGRPPRSTQFQPGQSGNPAGRPKGLRNFATDVKRTLQVPVRVKADGRSRNMSTQEAAVRVLREKALRGDARALDRLLDFAGRFNNEPTDTGAPEVSTDDRAILDAYAAELAKGSLSTSAPPPKIPRVRLLRHRHQTQDHPDEK